MKDINFVILCPACSLAGLRTTVGSVSSFGNCEKIAVVGENCNSNEIANLSKICKVVQAGKTITGLIDAGIKESSQGWNLIMMSGGWVRKNVIQKYDYFCRNEKDILYPVIDRKIGFDEASINGILMHRRAIEEVGDLGDVDPDLNRAKLLWALEAMEKGYNFKAIVGARLY